MSETLLLRLSNTGRPAQWLVVDAFGNSMGQSQSGELKDAAQFASGRRLRVCVPGSTIMLMHATIPSHNNQKILQAIPFALEDRLAQDVDTLHFAIGTRDSHGYPVAVVTRAHMQEWLDELSAAGLAPVEMLPDMQTLPVQEKTLVLALDDGQVLVRFPDATAIAAESSLIPLMVHKHLSALSESEACTAALVYGPEESVPGEIREMLTDQHFEVSYRPLSAGAIALMSGSVRESRAINLLQGIFTPQNSVAQHWRRWRSAAVLLAALFIVFVAQQGVSEYKLRHEASQLNRQAIILFHRALPNAKVPEDLGTLETRVKQRLKQISGGGVNSEGLLEMLTAIGNAVKTQHNVQIKSFSFHNDSLQLQLQADNIDSLNNMKNLLSENADLHVDMDSLNTSSGNTTGRLTVTGVGK